MNLLVPYDGSEYAQRSLREACRMAGIADTILVMAHVHATSPRSPQQQDVDYVYQRCRAEWLLADACEHAEQFGHYAAIVRTVQVEAPDRQRAILAAAEHWSADRIIMAIPTGWRGQLLLILHPMLRGLLRDAPCPVQLTFVRPKQRLLHDANRIVHPTRDDYKKESFKAQRAH